VTIDILTDAVPSPVHNPRHPNVPAHDAFIRACGPSSSVNERILVVEGDAGSGKSFALSTAATTSRASGHRVIEVSGRGDDIVMTSGSLAALMTLLPQAAHTREHMGSGGAADIDDARHVILIDDWHDLDTRSREQLHSALSYLARTTRTVCMISTRDRALIPGWSELQVVALTPLDTTEADALLLRSNVALSSSRRRLLLRLAGGSPLILDVVGRAWSAEPSEHAAAMFPAYPSDARLGDAERSRIERLSPFTRSRLLVSAVAQVEFENELSAASSAELAESLHEAVRAEIVSPARGSITFATPILRAAVLCAATDAELAVARTEAAAHTSAPDFVETFIEGAARVEPSDTLANQLALAAAASLRSGRADHAISATVSAARLTTSTEDRDRFLGDAADIAAYAGFLSVVDDAAQRLTSAQRDPSPRMVAAIAFSRVVRDGADRNDFRGLLALLDAVPDGDTADRLLAVLHTLCFYRGDNSWWDLVAAHTSDRSFNPILHLVDDLLNPGQNDSAQWSHLLAHAEDSLSDGATWKQVSLHIAWSLLDPTDPRRARIEHLFARAADDEDLPRVLRAFRAAASVIQRGAWQGADDYLDRARLLANQLGAGTLVALLDANRLVLLSLRGDFARTRAGADAATRWALDSGSPLVARIADHARSALDVAFGDFEEAHARSIAGPPISGRALQRGYGLVGLLDAVEAATRLHRPERSRALIDAARAEAGSHPPPRHQMILTACDAIVDEDDAARRLFDSALAVSGVEEVPFELARVRLAYGERLRRTMNPLEARTQFRIAAALFEGLGASQWLTRTQRELRAAGGVTALAHGPVNNGLLSEQERQIASLAASGLSNKQIAQQLYLSPRTVSGHLYRVFPKLGITSRAGLRDALAGIAGD
jgi:DNA-binding CsgD family transcriptional regulator